MINPQIVDGTTGIAPTLDAPDQTPDVGTLVMNSDGRSKFIGQSASFQWLRDVSYITAVHVPDLPDLHPDMTFLGHLC